MTRILLDVAELAPGLGKSVGIYNYARLLVSHLAPLLEPDWELHLACNAGGRPDFELTLPQVKVHTVLATRHPSILERQRWMRFGAQAFARKIGANVYMTPKGFLPGVWGQPMGLTTVAVLHDLIPLWYATHHPAQFSALERWVVNNGLLRTARYADHLIAISGATADDVAARVHRSGPGLTVVHNGVPHVVPRPVSPRSGAYLFAMTSTLPHKNPSGLIAAYRCYRSRTADPLPLVVCGGKDLDEPGVEVVRGLDEETLHTYYAHAAAFLFLPLIEGFGFPPLEAMSHGTPVVCSDIPVLREVTLGEAALAAPCDPDAVANALTRILASEREVNRAEARRAVVARFSWEACAAGVKSVLTAACFQAR